MARERIARQATHLRIIDGGRSNSSNFDEEIEVSSDFVDKVMERLDNEPRIVREREEVTIIEFCGPKRLPRVSNVVPSEQKEKKWNMRNFFRRK